MTGTELITIQSDLLPARQVTPAELFKENGIDPLIDEIEKMVRGHTPDLSTAKGRKEIASLAAKVSKAKVFLDETGKELVADIKKQTDVVDAERRKLRTRLDALRDEARQPLTEWEEAEAARVDALQKRLYDLENMDRQAGQMASTLVQILIDEAKEIAIDDSWQEYQEHAEKAKGLVLERLENTLKTVIKAEEQAAELKRLQDDAAARKKEDEAEAIRKAEEKRIADAAAETTRLANESAEKKIQEARDAQIRAEQKAETAAADERTRITNEQLQKDKETKEREANREHRAKINRAARDDMMAAIQADAMCQEDKRLISTDILTAISNGKVRNVKVIY